jgi:hypothetical protein
LIEEHAQFAILNSDTLVETLKDYAALVIPEQSILNQKECDAIRRFVHNGAERCSQRATRALATLTTSRSAVFLWRMCLGSVTYEA